MTATDTPREPARPSRSRPAPTDLEQPLRGAVSAEWVKFRSVRSTWWGLALTLVLTVSTALVGAVNLVTGMDRGNLPAADVPASEMVAYGAVWVGQFVLVGIALTFVTSEYASGSIRSSLQAVPARWRMLTAKAIVLGTVVLVAAVAISTVGTLITHLVLQHPLMGGYGTLTASETVVNVLRTSVFLTLVSLLALGVGTMTRSAATALTTVFMVILGLPVMMMLSSNELLHELFVRLPFTAGAAFLGSEHVIGPLEGMLSPIGGLVVLMFWTAAALTGAAVALRRRDA